MADQKRGGVVFEDYLPVMAEKLGGEALIGELWLEGLRDEELLSMLREGDIDGDGALNQMEFCVLMFRLSPDLMEESEVWLEQVLEREFMEGMSCM
ncbi:hypothetical protein Syun_010377 [Stephania yunnanensis]|uniref:EF-hand domain-containing protein n=1 Tax=Stephania yunnanensis TaxID=152371 RepID=A0AAP0KGE5_9MAGN